MGDQCYGVKAGSSYGSKECALVTLLELCAEDASCPAVRFLKFKALLSKQKNFNKRISMLWFLSCRKEWEELFVNNNYLATIRQKGINGQLRSSRFRSICWKLFLCVLPQDKSQWISRIKESRAWYSNIKEIHITNPRKVVGQQDLMINNPLSQDEGSLWNKFFQDKELRSMIEQDVKRT
ncbi:PREDICTED: TBC1 domain family member 5-like, partial [Galeopterus variegatus]|uniref:TBC1 domain family member 5-like n=1 Tax=Galeopterus variegatus TaxID=482537 RepID=A0ABM0Q2J6_GALVR